MDLYISLARTFIGLEKIKLDPAKIQLRVEAKSNLEKAEKILAKVSNPKSIMKACELQVAIGNTHEMLGDKNKFLLYMAKASQNKYWETWARLNKCPLTRKAEVEVAEGIYKSGEITWLEYAKMVISQNVVTNFLNNDITNSI